MNNQDDKSIKIVFTRDGSGSWKVLNLDLEIIFNNAAKECIDQNPDIDISISVSSFTKEKTRKFKTGEKETSSSPEVPCLIAEFRNYDEGTAKRIAGEFKETLRQRANHATTGPYEDVDYRIFQISDSAKNVLEPSAK